MCVLLLLLPLSRTRAPRRPPGPPAVSLTYLHRLSGAPRPVYNWTLDLVGGSITAEVFGPVQPDHVAVSTTTTLKGSCKEGVYPCVPRRDFRLITGDTEWNPCHEIPGE